MNKIALIVVTYQRPELTKIFLDYHKRQQEQLAKNGYELELICVGSEGEVSRSMATHSGWRYFEFPNNPLSRKVEHGFIKALEIPGIKGCVWIGSDDFLQYSLLEYYFKTFSASQEHVHGLSSMYFYSIKRDQTVEYFVHPRCPEKTVGTAKFYSRRVLDKMDWKICSGRACNRGVDSYAYREMKKKNITDIPFSMEQSGICMDVKAEVSMTNWDMIKGNPCNTVDNSILDNTFGEAMQKIKALRSTVNSEGLYSIMDKR